MATEQQLRKLVACLVEHQLEFGGLTNQEAQFVIQNPKAAIARIVEALGGAPMKIPNDFDLRYSTDKFLTLRDTIAGSPVELFGIENAPQNHKSPWRRCVQFGRSFAEEFIKKEEADVDAVEVELYSLMRPLDLRGLVLGGSDLRWEVSLCHYLEVLATYGVSRDATWMREEGVHIVAHICNGVGRLDAVYAKWSPVTHFPWIVDAGSSLDPRKWDKGTIVLARKGNFYPGREGALGYKRPANWPEYRPAA